MADEEGLKEAKNAPNVTEEDRKLAEQIAEQCRKELPQHAGPGVQTAGPHAGKLSDIFLKLRSLNIPWSKILQLAMQVALMVSTGQGSLSDIMAQVLALFGKSPAGEDIPPGQQGSARPLGQVPPSERTPIQHAAAAEARKGNKPIGVQPPTGDFAGNPTTVGPGPVGPRERTDSPPQKGRTPTETGKFAPRPKDDPNAPPPPTVEAHPEPAVIPYTPGDWKSQMKKECPELTDGHLAQIDELVNSPNAGRVQFDLNRARELVKRYGADVIPIASEVLNRPL